MDPLAPGDHRRRLWDSLPVKMFVDLSRLETFRSSHVSFLVKIRPSIASAPLRSQRVGDLPFGSLYLITCADVPVAYNLRAPRCQTRSGRNFAALMLRGRPPAEVRRVFVDGTFILLGDDSALVATIRQRDWIAA